MHEPSAGWAKGGGVGVRVRTPARLHFGFLDLHGGLGRRFGSLGLALDGPALDLEIRPARKLTAQGSEAGRLRRIVEAAAAHLGVPATVAVSLHEAIPAHAGFGSGTQLALAVAAGLARLHGRVFVASEAAAALDRGNRSGVGLAAFLQGGLIVDGGRDASGAPPPVVARLVFPEAWRVVLVIDSASRGVHGEDETRAFQDLPPFPEADAAHICRLVLMRILPAVAETDLTAFGRGVAEIQRRLGDFFAPYQGGRFASPAVADALAESEALGIEGVGQSSWGPTGFALVGSEAQAQDLVGRLARPDGERGRLRFVIARGRNQGADVLPIAAAQPRRYGSLKHA